jgi:hypothetical protein
MIFGMLRPGGSMDLDVFYGDVLEYLSHYDFGSWTLLSKRELQGANWKVAFDGYLETYHFDVVHRNSLAPFIVGGRTAYEAYGPHMHLASATPAVREMTDVPDDQRWKGEGAHFTILNLLFPNISFSLGLAVGQVAQILPGPNVHQSRTILYHLCPTAPTTEEEMRQREARRDFAVSVLQDEDYTLGFRVQKGVASQLPFRVNFGRNEPANQHFHKWIRHYVDGEPAGSAPKL